MLHRRRPNHLLSGLLACGTCGAQMIVRNCRGQVTYFGCSARINRLGCTNARSVTSREIEGRLLVALQEHLLQPDVISEAAVAYRAERQRLSREAAKSRGLAERQITKIRRKIAWLITEIENGRGSRNLSDRLAQLEGEEEAAVAQLAMATTPAVVELHPMAAERYRQKVEDIQGALMAGDSAGLEALSLVRRLVQQVGVKPAPRGHPVRLEIAGDLAALLTVNEKGTQGMASMVAGARNRHYLLFEALDLPVGCSG